MGQVRTLQAQHDAMATSTGAVKDRPLRERIRANDHELPPGQAVGNISWRGDVANLGERRPADVKPLPQGD
jgi:hypothetical protein